MSDEQRGPQGPDERGEGAGGAPRHRDAAAEEARRRALARAVYAPNPGIPHHADGGGAW